MVVLRGVASWLSLGLMSTTWDWRSSLEAWSAWVEMGGADVPVEEEEEEKGIRLTTGGVAG